MIIKTLNLTMNTATAARRVGHCVGGRQLPHGRRNNAAGMHERRCIRQPRPMRPRPVVDYGNGRR
jgi:hypothetical protein